METLTSAGSQCLHPPERRCLAALHSLDLHLRTADLAPLPLPPQPPFGLEETAAQPLPYPPEMQGGVGSSAPDLE